MKRLNTPQEDNLVLLCALEKLGPCTQEQLLRYTLDQEIVDQFMFYVALGGLDESGQIRKSLRGDEQLISLSTQGIKTVEMFRGKLRASIQEKLNQTAPEWHQRFREELSSPARWEKTPDGYRVTLRVLEDGLEIYSVGMLFSTREQAQRACRKWPETAASLFQDALAKLNAEDKAKEIIPSRE